MTTEWFRAAMSSVSVVLTEDRVQQRHAGALKLAGEADRYMVAQLVALGFESQLDSSAESSVRSLIREGDPTFPESGGNAEFKVLSAEALRLLLGGRRQVAKVAALALACSSLQGALDYHRCPGLTNLAVNYLSDRESTTTRIRPFAKLDLSDSQRLLVTQVQAVGNALASSEFSAAQSTLGEASESLETVLHEIETWTGVAASRFQAAQTNFSQAIESVIWMASKSSRQLQKPLREMDASAIAVAIGVDVFGFKKLNLGPPTLHDLVNGAIGSVRASDTLSMSTLRVNEDVHDLLGAHIPTGLAAALTPVLSMFMPDHAPRPVSRGLEEMELTVYDGALQILREIQLTAVLEDAEL